MAPTQRKLTSLTEIFTFFRTNQTPIYFVTPAPYNLLGIDQWVGNFEYITYFDSFDGYHPRCITPTETGAREFKSMEDVGNYLLGHKETADLVKARGGKGKALLIMFDETSEQLVASWAWRWRCRRPSCAPTSIPRSSPPSSATMPACPACPTRSAAPRASPSCAPSPQANNLGDHLVVQTPYGDSGRTTFFVRTEADWDKYADRIVGEDLKVMRYVNHMPGTVEGCATRHGTLVGPIMTDITGFAEVTPYKGGWCGNDVFADGAAGRRAGSACATMVQKLGDRLWQEGYKGVFCCDFLIDTDTDDIWLGEINPRISGASPPTNLITMTYGGCPLFLFHLLEFMDVDWELDLAAVQARWATTTPGAS